MTDLMDFRRQRIIKKKTEELAEQQDKQNEALSHLNSLFTVHEHEGYAVKTHTHEKYIAKTELPKPYVHPKTGTCPQKPQFHGHAAKDISDLNIPDPYDFEQLKKDHPKLTEPHLHKPKEHSHPAEDITGKIQPKQIERKGLDADMVDGKHAKDLIKRVYVGGAVSEVAGVLSQIQVRDAANVWTDVGYYTGNLNVPVEVKNAIDVIDKADRLLGRVYGNLDQLQQRATTKELLVWINNFPTDYPDSAVLAQLDVVLSTRLAEATFTARWDAGMFGWDGTAARKVKTDINGELQTDVLTLPVTKGDWLSVLPNPSNLDVLLSSRSNLMKTDFDAKLDVVLSSRLAETTFTGRFPASVSLSDVLANPTTTLVGDCLLGWDAGAAVWERICTDGANRLKAQLDGIPNPPNLDVALSTRLKPGDLNLDVDKDLQVDVKTTSNPPNLDVALSTRLKPADLNLDAEKDLQVDVKTLPTVSTVGETKTFKTARIDHATAGDNAIVAAVTGKRIKVYAVVLVVSAAVNCKWRSATTDLTGDMNFGGKGEGYAQAVQPPAFLFATAAGEALNLNLSAAVAVDGHVTYWDDDAT